MRRPSAIVLLSLLLALPAFVRPASAEEGGARTVEALLTVRHDPDSRAVVWPEVAALLKGSPREAWSGPAPAVLSQPADTYRLVEVEREEADDPGVLCVRIRLETRSPDPQLRADRLLDALVERVRRHAVQQAQDEREAMRRMAEELQAAVDARTQAIATGRTEGALPWPLSAAAFYENKLDRREGIRSELADLALDAATLDARREVLTTQYEALRQQEAADEARDADFEREWQTVLRSREALVAEVRANVEAGKADPLELAMAEEELAQARLQRAAMRREARTPSAARRDLEVALLGLQVDAAALRATRQHLETEEKRLTAELEAGKADVLRVSRLEDETQVLRQRLLELREVMAAWRAPGVDVIRLD